MLSVLETCLDHTDDESEIDFYAETIYPILKRKENSIYLQSDEEYIECLSWENELMGTAMSTEKGINILKDNHSEKYDGSAPGYCNFLVLSCSEKKTTKKGNTYYEVLLSDVTGYTITRRFSEKITSACARLYVQADSKKYFTTDCSKEKPYSRSKV